MFIVPEDDHAAFHLGRQLGAFLMYGSQEALTALGLAEVACMRMSELRALVPNAPEAVLVLIDTGLSPMGVTAFEGPLPPPYRLSLPPELAELDFPEGDPRYWPWREAEYLREDLYVEQGIGAVGALLLHALGHALATASPTERVQALIRTRALLQLSVSGGKWARDEGCGIEIERHLAIQLMPLCGMGYMPERAQRFLYFYSAME